MEKRNKTALVVLSGGQDSVTCLGWAIACYQRVIAISFAYNQKHVVELECAAKVCAKHHIEHRIVQLGTMLSSLVTSALTGVGEVGLPHAYKPGLPSSFVPGRNALFLTLAHAYAQEKQAEVIVTGVCETDFSGYPDCREAFIRLFSHALNEGYETKIQIVTPLMHLTKAQTFALAEEVGFLDEVIDDSHTCYNGDHTTKHDWGFGCGTCPACLLRAKGYAEYVSGKQEEERDDRDKLRTHPFSDKE